MLVHSADHHVRRTDLRHSWLWQGLLQLRHIGTSLTGQPTDTSALTTKRMNLGFISRILPHFRSRGRHGNFRDFHSKLGLRDHDLIGVFVLPLLERKTMPHGCQCFRKQRTGSTTDFIINISEDAAHSTGENQNGKLTLPHILQGYPKQCLRILGNFNIKTKPGTKKFSVLEKSKYTVIDKNTSFSLILNCAGGTTTPFPNHALATTHSER